MRWRFGAVRDELRVRRRFAPDGDRGTQFAVKGGLPQKLVMSHAELVIANSPPRTSLGERNAHPREQQAAVWIVHRDEAAREELATRLGLVGAQTLDPREVSSAQPAPRVAVLAPVGDFEAELELALRTNEREPRTRWLILATDADLAEARRLFDLVPGEILPLGTDAGRLRDTVSAMLTRRDSPPLSERLRRRRVTARFTRWFADLNNADLFAATDPKRVRVPILIRGEAGTGRGTLARYLHQLATGVPAGPLLSLSASAIQSPEDFITRWRTESGAQGTGQITTLCLENVDALPEPLIPTLIDWLDYGPDAALGAGMRWRFILTVASQTPAALLESWTGLTIDLPPLRSRRDALTTIAAEAAREWCDQHELPRRGFSGPALEALSDYAWPGNLNELEAVVARTLAASTTGSEPIAADALRFAEAATVDDALPLSGDDALEAPLYSDDESALEPEPFDFAVPGLPLRPAIPSDTLRRLAGALMHELGNPLVGIRSFASMLPRRFDDPEFRRLATERVQTDTERIERVLEVLAALGGTGSGRRDDVDISGLIAGLLAERRERIHERRLVVLEELDRESGTALGDREQLHGVLGRLFDAILDAMAERGDLYIATQSHPSSEGGPLLRILLRFQTGESPGATPTGDDDPHSGGLLAVDQSLGLAAAVAELESSGASVALDLGEAPAVLLAIDLPTALAVSPA